MPLAATYRRVDMKALARYQIILLGNSVVDDVTSGGRKFHVNARD